MEEYKNIYIVVPYGVTTGGPETLHQICSIVNAFGKSKCFMVYIDSFYRIVNCEIEKKYSKYNVFETTKIDDSIQNLLISSEYNSYFLCKYKYIVKKICWLSYDNYFNFFNKIRQINLYYLKTTFFNPIIFIFLFMRSILKMNYRKKLPFNEIRKISNSYNCEYVKEELIKHNIFCKYYLCGPISDDYLDLKKNNQERSDIVLYNPAKGFNFTKKIIKEFRKKYGDRVKFIAIKGMNNNEIINLMSKSKVYIDFGYFPGPERLPRQAVVLGCNIITSDVGASKYGDIKIRNEFKFKISKKLVPNICAIINDMILNYFKYYPLFSEYRKIVYDQKTCFKDDVISFVYGRKEFL